MQSIQPWRFNSTSGQWETSQLAGEIDSPLQRLRVLTWNVWFDEYLWKERADALIEIVRAHDPDVIALQEVTPSFLPLLCAQPWVRDNYAVSDAAGASVDPYGALLLSRIPLRALWLQALPSFMGRRLVMGEFLANGEPLRVGSIHLESRKPNAHLRREQLTLVFEALAASPQAVLMGDFNFCGDWEDENSQIPSTYIDVWPALRPTEGGRTVDSVANQMRARHKEGTKRTRFDRVLLRSELERWKPLAISMLGTEAVLGYTPEVFPSDHFGLVAEFEWDKR